MPTPAWCSRRGPRPPMISLGGVDAPSRRPSAGSDAASGSWAARPCGTLWSRRCLVPKTVPQLPGIPPSDYPFSQVVEANGFVFLAGQVGDAPGTHGPVPGGIAAETRAMLDNVGRLLEAVGLGFGDVVKCTVYLLDFSEFAAMNA